MLTHEEVWNNLVERIKEEEGFRSKVYLDHLGFQTIGYGTNIQEGLSEDEAEALLIMRLKEMAMELSRAAGINLPDLPAGIRIAVLDMAYNMGVPRLMQFRNMWEAIYKGEVKTAAAEVLDSNYAKQVPNRAKRNSELIAESLDEYV